ncbi:MAG: type III-B CRISPR module RAMP protein Cmr6 [Bernardetiaceae bacterium]|nr:type III-B CRISPR module RAMP protein Cmr6 [Bernardetiaceae bacterium]
MAKMNLEAWQEKNNSSKRIKAKIISVVSERGFCFLSSENVDKIFLHFNQLRSFQSSNPNEGDELEVEVSQGTKGHKVDRVISYNPVEPLAQETESTNDSIPPDYEGLLNFYSFLHKRKRFFTKDLFLTGRRGGSKKVADSFDIKRISDESIHSDDTEYKEIFDVFKHWNTESFYQNLCKRHHFNALQLTAGNLEPKLYETNRKNDLQFKPDWSLAIGLGSGSVFETSITLHHIYGFPYIPASAVKGALRSFVITTVFGKNEAENEPLLNAEFRALQNKSFCRIFGCPDKVDKVLFDEQGNPRPKANGKEGEYQTQKVDVALKDTKGNGLEHSGSIIFFDAYPCESPRDKIKADIMNPHYPDYYGNKNLPPADWQSPNPVIFLTVKDLRFQFLVGLKKGVENESMTLNGKSGTILSTVSTLLRDSLEMHGIGAKTAVGYGYMQNPD